MTTLSFDKRERLSALRREMAEILDPMNREAKAKRKAYRAAMVKRVGKREQGQRQPRERDPGFLAFLRRQPCAVAHLGGCSGPIEAAHIRYSDASKGRNPGMQAKNHDRNANPLCRHHHQHDQHRRSERAFWEAAGLDAYDNAARLYAEYTA